jgi:hypothetical protein
VRLFSLLPTGFPVCFPIKLLTVPNERTVVFVLNVSSLGFIVELLILIKVRGKN